MNISLFALNSSYIHTNLAVRYLASELKDTGHNVQILEYNLKDKRARILHALVSAQSDIYAFSAYIWNIEEMLKYAKMLKDILSDCHIIFGGPEVSFENEEFFTKYPFIDTIIRGEGEAVIGNTCDNIDKYYHQFVNGKEGDFTKYGILYDQFPAKGSILYYESSRGCPHKCSYCLSSLTPKVKAKSADITLKELLDFEKLSPKPKIIKFVDRTFNFDLKRAKIIWRALLSDKYKLNYHFEICADKLDAECFEILAQFPIGKIQFEAGIQSTNEKTLNEIKRKTDTEKALNNLKKIKTFGNIHVHADLIVGLPHETIENFKRSFNETIGVCDKLQIGFLKLLKGSHLRGEVQKHGYIFEDTPPYTVLANSYISYEDIYELQGFSDTIERYYCKDGFNNSMKYLLLDTSSDVFESFMSLHKSLPAPIDKISQYNARAALYHFSQNNFKDERFISLMAMDSLIYENKTPLPELTQYYHEIKGDTYVDIIKNAKKKINTQIINKPYIYEFSHDPDNYYIIDRTEHKYIKINK